MDNFSVGQRIALLDNTDMAELEACNIEAGDEGVVEFIDGDRDRKVLFDKRKEDGSKQFWFVELHNMEPIE
mgnify:CR=1 FL=1